MSFILDTVVFLWILKGEQHKLSKQASKSLEKSEILYISSVSTWEIAIKYSIGRLVLKESPHIRIPLFISEMGFRMLPIHSNHTLGIIELPHIHKDPFDRLLISQAKIENLPILTPDPIFKKYKIHAIW